MAPSCKTVAIVSLAPLVLLATGRDRGSVAAGADRPNIVVILADDLGYGDVQSLNPARGRIRTPHIDRLAREGMVFTDAHSGSSVCTPTRYGLLTGRYAWRTQLQRGVLGDYVTPLIDADRLTVPGLLKQHGYHSACIGKWHLGFTVDGEQGRTGDGSGRAAALGAVTRNGPTTRGFDTFAGFHHARMMEAFFEGERVAMQVEPEAMLPLLSGRAVEYVSQRAAAGEPFFLYLALNSPHTPIAPSPSWRGRSGLGSYGDFVMETDGTVGAVLAALQREKIADNTLVVFTSDNGCSPQAGIARLERQGHFVSAGYRGYKSDIWEGGHRVPLVVRWPGKVQAGLHSDQLVCLTDLMATCAEILSTTLPAQAGEDSESILPALLGKVRGSGRTTIVHHSIQGKFAIRRGPWKLCLCAGSGGWSQGAAANPQLYDLAADPAETQNLAAAHPEIVAELGALLRSQIAQGRSTPGPRQANDVPVHLGAARATGRCCTPRGQAHFSAAASHDAERSTRGKMSQTPARARLPVYLATPHPRKAGRPCAGWFTYCSSLASGVAGAAGAAGWRPRRNAPTSCSSWPMTSRRGT